MDVVVNTWVGFEGGAERGMPGRLFKRRKERAAAAPDTPTSPEDTEWGEAAPTKESPESHPVALVLTPIATLLAILAIPLYVAGARYRSSYFKGFAIPTEDMDLPIYETLLEGAEVMLLPVPSLVLAILAIIFFTFLLNQLLKTHRMVGIGTFVVVFLVLGSTMFHLGGMLGTRHSRRDMQKDKTALPDVTLELATPARSEAERAIDGKSHRLVAHVNGHYYIFDALEPPTLHENEQATRNLLLDYGVALKPPDEMKMNVTMYVVPDSRVRHARIVRPVGFSPEIIEGVDQKSADQKGADQGVGK